MINLASNEIVETIKMIRDEHLDIRTITMGISLLDCADEDCGRACTKIYDKIMRCAKNLVSCGEEISQRLGIPIINKRVSVTPIALVAAASKTDNYLPFAKTLDRAARELGINFIVIRRLCTRAFQRVMNVSSTRFPRLFAQPRGFVHRSALPRQKQE